MSSTAVEADWTYTDRFTATGSSNISQMWYNENTKVLGVEFLSGEEVYGYRGVPVEVWDELKRQQTLVDRSNPYASVGKYFIREVKQATDDDTGLRRYPGLMLGDGLSYFEDATVVKTVAAAQDLAWGTHEENSYEFEVTGTKVVTVTISARNVDDALAQARENGLDPTTVTLHV